MDPRRPRQIGKKGRSARTDLDALAGRGVMENSFRSQVSVAALVGEPFVLIRSRPCTSITAMPLKGKLL